MYLKVKFAEAVRIKDWNAFMAFYTSLKQRKAS